MLAPFSPHTSPPIARPPAVPAGVDLEARLQAALSKVAQLVVDDPTFIPVFERLGRELANIPSQNDAVDRARALLRTPRQNAMP